MSFGEARGVIELGNVKIKCVIFTENKENELELIEKSISNFDKINN